MRNIKIKWEYDFLFYVMDNKLKNITWFDKINKCTIVNALDDEGEVEEGRKLIKELVREIDRCVSILNSKE